jgi:hypothetical protein
MLVEIHNREKKDIWRTAPAEDWLSEERPGEYVSLFAARRTRS